MALTPTNATLASPSPEIGPESGPSTAGAAALEILEQLVPDNGPDDNGNGDDLDSNGNNFAESSSFSFNGGTLSSGSSGDDTLLGGPGRDFQFGLDGDDLLRGRGGDDVQFGGSGDDTLEGDGGDDVQFGGAGNDILRPGAGNDFSVGGPGSDTHYLGTGIDIHYGDSLGGGDVDADQFRVTSETTGFHFLADYDASTGDTLRFEALENGDDLNVVQTPFGALIQGDFNGDGTNDGGILLAGVQANAIGDIEGVSFGPDDNGGDNQIVLGVDTPANDLGFLKVYNADAEAQTAETFVVPQGADGFFAITDFDATDDGDGVFDTLVAGENVDQLGDAQAFLGGSVIFYDTDTTDDSDGPDAFVYLAGVSPEQANGTDPDVVIDETPTV